MKRASKLAHRISSLDSNVPEASINQPFPTVRYFQVHFEELYAQLRQMQITVDKLQKQLVDIKAEQKLTQLNQESYVNSERM